jgi:ubiquinone/menaquinone biosynthesis C-methylase UbiE
MRIGLGKESRWLMNFKEIAPSLSAGQLEDYYRSSEKAHLERETDLNSSCIEKILRSVVGETILDIACGRGYLSKRLSASHRVTGADFVVNPRLRTGFPDVSWDQANIERLQYQDLEFDTVICAHTLEHVLDIDAALSELRRVAKKRLIIVLPCQRAYQYTFDLHVHFFTYQWQVELLMKSADGQRTGRCCKCGGDWVYIEDYPVVHSSARA